MRALFTILLLGLSHAATISPDPQNTPLGELSMDSAPANIQLQNLWQSYNQEQQLNPKADAEADAPIELQPYLAPKTNRQLKTSLLSKHNDLRELEDAADAPPTEAPADQNAQADATTDAGSADGAPAAPGAPETIDGIIDRLLKRADMLDDKIDHLLFHNHHDLAGMTAYYTPYGVQMLPSKKSKDSVDQKLKMIDYMHNLGGGYNPMLHTMLPYYLGQETGPEGEQQKGIKMGDISGIDLSNRARKKKVL